MGAAQDLGVRIGFAGGTTLTTVEQVRVEQVRSDVRWASQAGFAYSALPSYRAMLDREGITDPTELILTGSMSEIADGLAAYVDAGATDLRLGIYAPDDAHNRATRDALAEWVA